MWCQATLPLQPPPPIQINPTATATQHQPNPWQHHQPQTHLHTKKPTPTPTRASLPLPPTRKYEATDHTTTPLQPQTVKFPQNARSTRHRGPEEPRNRLEKHTSYDTKKTTRGEQDHRAPLHAGLVAPHSTAQHSTARHSTAFKDSRRRDEERQVTQELSYTREENRTARIRTADEHWCLGLSERRGLGLRLDITLNTDAWKT